ncbi:MAG: folate-binding protein YgfZ [Dechloromonas sp.]|nr:folate-binding protein YgfZ [Dechloromonas sp.]
MNPNWRSFLQSADAVFDSGSDEIVNFGDAADELQSARSQTILVPLTHLGLIAASGDDAKTFLQNQFTSDINHLGADQVQHSAWCTAKGRMQASFLVWREADAFLLIVSGDLEADSLRRLQMFVLRSKVKLAALTGNRLLLGLAGPHAGAALEEAGLPCPVIPMTQTIGEKASVIALGANRYIAVVQPEGVVEMWTKLTLKARPAGLPAWRWLDVQAGFPLISAVTKEEFVPQMADFERLGGVSFHKGCYPGQEVVARTQYLGKVKRHLYRISSDQPLAAGADLHSPDNPDQACGKIVSSAPSPAGGFEALAVVQSSAAGNLRLGSHEGPKIQAVAVNP